MSTATRFLTLAFVSTFASPITSANTLWIVNANGPGNSHTLAPVVNAAEDKDTVLIKSGTYGGCTIDDKTLSIVAEVGSTVSLNAPIVIKNLSADKYVVIGGININPTTSVAALRLEDNIGAVRLQSVILTGRPAAVSAVSNSDVILTQCTLNGKQGGHEGSPGLSLVGTDAALYDCVLTGANGGYATGGGAWPDGGPGGPGCSISLGGSLFASNTTFNAGNGGNGGSGSCIPGRGSGGNGGSGIAISSSAHANLLGCTLQPGAAGLAGSNGTCAGAPGSPGIAINNPALVTMLQGRPRTLHAPFIARENTELALSSHGMLGDVVYLEIARQTVFQFFPAFRGVFTIPQPASTVLLQGQIDATGSLASAFFFPELGRGEQSRVYFLQSIHSVGGSDRTLASGLFLVLIDSMF